MGRDMLLMPSLSGIFGFNPRARMGRDSVPHHREKPSKSFNPRARMGRDVRPPRGSPTPKEFQSTRPHGARHLEEQSRLIMVLVSIHAPAWGATYTIDQIEISCLFQSTRPHGARHPNPDRLSDRPPVSIHAPAWGATPQRRCILS